MGADFSQGWEDREIRREQFEARSEFEKSAGVPLSLAGKLLCSGLALMAGADSSLLVCRGYVVLPDQGLFMEHWWCRHKAKDIVFDPLTDLLFARCKYTRLEVGAEAVQEYDGVGTFDCLAMSGECDRMKSKRPRCEWCQARKKIEAKHSPCRAMELVVGLSLAWYGSESRHG